MKEIFSPEDFITIVARDERVVDVVARLANSNPKLLELIKAVEEAKVTIEFCLSQVMLPHQITHDELEMSCNKAVSAIQKWLGKYGEL